MIRAGYLEGMVERVYAGETRPWLHGSRLTAWELANEGIGDPVRRLGAGPPDEEQGHHLGGGGRGLHRRQRRRCQQDRHLPAGGQRHAPRRTFHGGGAEHQHRPEPGLGEDIPLEERAADELLDIGGTRVAPDVEVFNPVFDVTPADLIDVIVTERGIVERPDAAKLAQLICRKRLH